MNKTQIFVLATCLVLGGCQSGTVQVDAAQPNILFLFADDQAFNTIRALGNPVIQTPNLDRLVAQGMTFTHAFNQGSWSGAVCIVSRAMLNSGRYIYHAREDIDRIPLWGNAFSDAGYATFLTGKWHNGDATALKGFEQGISLGKGMFETKGGPDGPGYRRPTPDNNSWSASDRSLLGHWSPEVKDIIHTDSGKVIGPEYVVEQHTSELYADNAIAFMEHHSRASDEPFFMYVAFNAPHDPRQAPQEYLDLYPVDSIPLPPNYMEEHPFDQGERYTLRDEILGPFPRTELAVKTQLREYYAIISHMDAQIGRILAKLEELGLDENTYIVFTADHGLAMGSHGLMGKQNQYEHSIRVPLMITGPDVPTGATSDALVYLQSVHPTTLELAGVPVPELVEFKSLVPLIRDPAGSSYENIFGSYKDYQRMIRTDTYKLIVYPEVEEVQLFNIKEDPAELVNLARTSDHAEITNQLYQDLLALQAVVGDTLQLPDSPAVLMP